GSQSRQRALGRLPGGSAKGLGGADRPGGPSSGGVAQRGPHPLTPSPEGRGGPVGEERRPRSCQGKRQMSSTPLAAWEFEFPSGSAIFPSITIGLFQCPLPHARSASCTPVSDRYTRSPPPFGSYTKRRVSAMTGLVPAL